MCLHCLKVLVKMTDHMRCKITTLKSSYMIRKKAETKLVFWGPVKFFKRTLFLYRQKTLCISFKSKVAFQNNLYVGHLKLYVVQ